MQFLFPSQSSYLTYKENGTKMKQLICKILLCQSASVKHTMVLFYWNSSFSWFWFAGLLYDRYRTMKTILHITLFSQFFLSNISCFDNLISLNIWQLLTSPFTLLDSRSAKRLFYETHPASCPHNAAEKCTVKSSFSWFHFTLQVFI